jgi:hypothetical protein
LLTHDETIEEEIEAGGGLSSPRAFSMAVTQEGQWRFETRNRVVIKEVSGLDVMVTG